MSLLSYDVAFARMSELAADMAAAKGRNEATTRLQLVDRLVFDCLGWDRDRALLEDHESGEYADYLLDDQARYLIVEAKRDGAWFELPLGTPRLTSLASLYGLRGTIVQALDQAAGYAQKRGAPYAVICNGHQLVAFVGSRQDGVAPRDGRALVFETPASFVDDFSLLWETLSPEGCRGRRLSRRLAVQEAAPPPRLSEQIADYPGLAAVDERQTMLATLRTLFLPNYVRDDDQEIEFLRECYSPSGAYSQLSAINKGVLRARYSQALGQELRVGLEDARSKDGLSKNLLEQVAATSADREPIVLLGDVGVGKTMFLRRLLLVDAQELAEQGVILYVDLGRSAVLGDLKDHVTRALHTQLLEQYKIDINAGEFVRGTYHAEVRQFAKSIDGPLAETDPAEFKRREIDHLRALTQLPEEHLRRSLEHLVKLRRKQIVIVLDNIDQRDASDQDQVFLMAETFASRWPCTVFVTLRPETFHASRVSGALSGYQPRAFTVQPPRVERVVLERLKYGQRHYDKTGQLPAWIGYTAQSDDLRRYLQILIKSFSRNGKLQAMLVQLSGGNARRALELVSIFVQSPHAEGGATLERRGEYLVPHHLFLRAALLGDRVHYDASASLIPNLFDISTDDAREHFLAPALLGLLIRAADARENDGYMSAEAVFQTFQDMGFSVDQIDFAVIRAATGGLIDVLPPMEADSISCRAVSAMRVTEVGHFSHQALTREFQYLDAVVIATPIADAAVRQRLSVVFAIRQRLDRAEIFGAYLDAAWADSGVADADLFDWPAASAAIGHEIAAIRARL